MATTAHPWRRSKNETMTAWGGHRARVLVLRWLIHVQSAYYAVMAVWPLLDINSFQIVTGPKTDLWLVVTVSWLLLATAITLETALNAVGSALTAAVLGLSNALVLAGIDLYYTHLKMISPIYRLDACIELVLTFVWLVLLARSERWRGHGT